MQEGGVDTHDVRKVCTQHQGLNAKNVVPANNRIGKHIYNVRRKKSGQAYLSSWLFHKNLIWMLVRSVPYKYPTRVCIVYGRNDCVRECVNSYTLIFAIDIDISELASSQEFGKSF